MTGELGSLAFWMSWTPWQSVQRATTRPFADDAPWCWRSDAVLPWKSARYVRRTAVERPYLLHQGFVRVAAAAELDRLELPLLLVRPADVVRAVAVGAHGHVRRGRSVEIAPMHALGVRRRDPLVAARAGLRDARARLGRLLDVVRAVAIDADRRGAIAARDRRLVHAVERLRVVGEVAAAALLVVGQREFAMRAEVARLVRDLRLARVAIRAREACVDGLGEDARRPRAATAAPVHRGRGELPVRVARETGIGIRRGRGCLLHQQQRRHQHY